MEKEQDKTLDANFNGKTTISTTVHRKVWQLAKKNNIAWNEALEFGILFKIADAQGYDYPSNFLSLKILKLAEQISNQQQEIENLKKLVPQIDPAQLNREADAILDELIPKEDIAHE